MELTSEQIEQRRFSINSSEMPALFNCARPKRYEEDEEKEGYENVSDLWLRKTGRVEPEEGNSEEAEFGHAIEPALIAWCEKQIKRPIFTEIELDLMIEGVRHRSHPDGSVLMGVTNTFEAGPILKEAEATGTFRGLIEAGVEGKSTRLYWEYGEEEADVPLKVLLQGHHQMMCAGPQCQLTHVPVVLPGLKLKRYEIKREEAIIDRIIERSAWFQWHVDHDKMPEDTTPTEEILKRRKRPVLAPIDLSDEVGELWLKRILAIEQRDHWKETERQYWREIVTALGDHESGRLPDGALLTYLEQRTAGSLDKDELRTLLDEAQREIDRQINELEFLSGKPIERSAALDVRGIYDKVYSPGKCRVLRKREFKAGRKR